MTKTISLDEEAYERLRARSDRPESERSRVLEVLDSKHVAADHEVMQDAETISGE